MAVMHPICPRWLHGKILKPRPVAIATLRILHGGITRVARRRRWQAKRCRKHRKNHPEEQYSLVHLLFCKRRDEPPDQMRSKRPRQRLVKFVDNLIEALRVWQAVALADVVSQQVA